MGLFGRLLGRRGAVQQLEHEAKLLRTEVREGEFQRAMALTAAFSAIVSGWEAYTQHERGAFSHKLMWTPVWLTPPMVASAGAAVVSKRAARSVLPLVSLANIIDGMVGFGYHLRGINRMPGGFKLGRYNVVMGPPVFAPLLMTTVGVAGGLASLLRRGHLEHGPRELEQIQDALESVEPSFADEGPLERLKLDVEYGRFQQGMALTSAFFAVLAGGEAYFEHLRGSFNQRLMWTPIWVTPPMVAAGIGAARSRGIARRVLPAMATITFLDGLLGFGLHLRGIKRMPGHFTNLQFNLMMGPPLFAPLLFCSVGLLGWLAALQRREKDVP